MLNAKASIIGLGIVAVLIGIAIGYILPRGSYGTLLSANSKGSVSQSLSETSTSPSLWPTISEFYVASDSFVAEGRGLVRVDVLSIPAGTEVTRERYQRMGNMTKKSEQSAKQIWTMPLACPGLVTNVLAIGWNASGQEVGELYLPYNGVTEIAKILCPNGIR